MDAVEAIRLADVEGLYQDAAAEQMGISRQTYARILTRAREAVARCLIEGRMLLIDNGAAPPAEGDAPLLKCPVHGGHRRLGRTCHCPDCQPNCGRGCTRHPHEPSS
jgi:uncharacterized protein